MTEEYVLIDGLQNLIDSTIHFELADVPDYTCKPPPDITLNDSIPVVYDNGRWRWSQCSQYVNKSQSNVTQTCQHGYQYDPYSGYESTIVTDVSMLITLIHMICYIYDAQNRDIIWNIQYWYI